MVLTSYATPPCPLCGKGGFVRVNPDQVAAWRAGMLAQYAFPDLSSDEREQIMTGTHPDCWRTIVGSDY